MVSVLSNLSRFSAILSPDIAISRRVFAEPQECHDLEKQNLNQVSCVRGFIVVLSPA
jgi:hypothetical protein